MVTALTSDMLDERQVTNVLDVAAQVPNLRIEPVTGGGERGAHLPARRGENRKSLTNVTARSVSTWMASYGRSSALFDFIDVERIEVLRGPQDPLRRIPRPALKIISHRPTDELRADLDFTIGNYDRRQVRGRSADCRPEASMPRSRAQERARRHRPQRHMAGRQRRRQAIRAASPSTRTMPSISPFATTGWRTTASERADQHPGRHAG